MNSVTAAACMLLLGAMLAAPSISAAPAQMTYQGQLSGDGGTAVPDGNYNFAFSIWSDSVGGSMYWSESQMDVAVTGGNFSAILGSTNPLSDSVFTGDVRFLQVSVEGETLLPRHRLTTHPYSFRVRTVDGAGGGTIDGALIIQTGSAGAKGTVTGLEIVDSTGATLIQAAAAPYVSSTMDFYDPVDSKAGLAAETTFAAQVGSDGLVFRAPIASWPPDTTVMVTRDGYMRVETHRGYAGYFETDSLSYDTRAISGVFSGTGSYDGIGVYGTAIPRDGYGWGGRFIGGWRGVYASVSASGGEPHQGILGEANGGTGPNIGVWGSASTTMSTARGVYGIANSASASTNYGVYGQASGAATNYAGYFQGNAHVTGTLSKGAGAFRIDHPLDPENKYLQHSFVESPDMMNVYNGNITTDAQGYAAVTLPGYFEALNRDFRYQLTVIGQFAQAIISEKISGGRFVIQTDKPNVEVSWQVTGIRKDPYAETHRIEVEVDKGPEDRGLYAHPEAFGLNPSRGVDARNEVKESR